MKMSVLKSRKSAATGINRPKHANSLLRPFVFFMGALAIALPCAAIAVQPTFQIFTVKAGKSVDAQMTVTNDTKDVLTYHPFVKEWFPTKENKGIKAQDWLKIPTRDFTLKPGESHVFKYEVVAPKKAKGELNAAVSFSHPQPGGMVIMQMSLVQYLAIEGTERLEAKVPGIAVRVSSDTSVGVMVQNPGNVHLRPKGWIYVTNDAGERIMNVEINTNQPVFPGAQRDYSGTVKGFVLPAGDYTARVELADTDRDYKFPPVNKKFRLTADGKVEPR